MGSLVTRTVFLPTQQGHWVLEVVEGTGQSAEEEEPVSLSSGPKGVAVLSTRLCSLSPLGRPRVEQALVMSKEEAAFLGVLYAFFGEPCSPTSVDLTICPAQGAWGLGCLFLHNFWMTWVVLKLCMFSIIGGSEIYC